MSLVDFLLQNRTPLELAKELAATAKDNAHLKEKIARLECEVFWLKVEFGGSGGAISSDGNRSRNAPDSYITIEW